MAAITFCFPVAHHQTTPVTKGDRSFFQPIQGAPANTVGGIEIFLPDAAPGKRLYACLEGKLAWRPGVSGAPNRLELLVSPTVTKNLEAVAVIEARPNKIVYENVERNGVRAALISTLGQAYTATSGQPIDKWHPAMRQRFKAKEKAPEKTIPSTIKTMMDENGGTAFATNIVDDLLNGVDRDGLRFRAGDHIGDAQTRLISTPPDVQRQLVFYMIDVGDQRINPLHYLHLYTHLPNATQISVDETVTGHPLVAAFPELSAGTRPPPRIARSVGGFDEDDFALGNLTLFHKTLRGLISWKLNPNRKIEVDDGGELVPVASDISSVTNVWNNNGKDIADVCDAAQVPCELATAIISEESSGDPKAYRFEPMLRKSIGVVTGKGQGALLLKYDKMLATRVVSYTPTRKAPLSSFGANPLTTLALTTETAVQLTGFGKIAESASRSVFLVNDVWRPVLNSYATTPNARTNHSVDLKEERVLEVLTASDSASTPAGWDGRIRVVRGKLARVAPVAMTITLTVAGKPPISFQIDKGKTDGASDGSSVEVTAGASVSVSVSPTVAGKNLQVEWFLGVKGNDGQPQTTGTSTGITMWMIPDGGGTANRTLFSDIPQLPFDASVAVRKDRTLASENMTWGEVVTMIGLTKDGTNPGGEFLSPGLTQTLVSTAYSVLKQSAGLAQALGIVQVANPGELISTGWLLQPKNAIFAGVGLLRLHYNSRGTAFDVPYVHGWYFGGGPLGKDVSPRRQDLNGRWGVNSPTLTFIDLVSRRYNAAVDLFNSAPTRRATVRFAL